MPNLSYCEVCYLFTTLRSSNNIAMLYFMSFAKEAIAHLTRRKSSLHLASQVVGRMGKPAQNYQAPLTGKHVRCDSICGFSSTAMNLFQISAGSLDSKGSYFLPCFTIWWWTKWLLSQTAANVPVQLHSSLQKLYSREADVTLTFYMKMSYIISFHDYLVEPSAWYFDNF